VEKIYELNYRVAQKKVNCILLVDISTKVGSFLKFFHCYTQQEICNKKIITDLYALVMTSLVLRRVRNCPAIIIIIINGIATLPCEILMSENITYPICSGTVF